MTETNNQENAGSVQETKQEETQTQSQGNPHQENNNGSGDNNLTKADIQKMIAEQCAMIKSDILTAVLHKEENKEETKSAEDSNKERTL